MKIEVSIDEVNNGLHLYQTNTRIDPDTAILMFGKLPVIWSRAEFMTNIYVELENLVGESAASVMKRFGKKYGKDFYKMLKDGDTALFINDKEKLYRYICAETQAIGWGQISIEEEGGGVIITSKGFASGMTFARKGEKHGTPIDSYFVGYFEGFLSEMSGKKFTGEEVECVAMGDGQCKMIFSSEPRV